MRHQPGTPPILSNDSTTGITAICAVLMLRMGILLKHANQLGIRMGIKLDAHMKMYTNLGDFRILHYLAHAHVKNVLKIWLIFIIYHLSCNCP